MTLHLNSRHDIDIAAVERVAWRDEHVALAATAMQRMTAARTSFLRLLDEPDTVIYGVTSGYGPRAHVRFDAEQRRRHAALPPYSAMTTFGPLAPARVARAIALARLSNFVDGHAAVTPALAEKIVALLNNGNLPGVPLAGNGGAGEILALSQLFSPLFATTELAEKEALALINGSPCAAALVADSAIAARRRLTIIEDIFALAFEALAAPLEHIDPVLGELWADTAETQALAALRQRISGGSDTRRNYQAPVSFRILPRMLGRLRRAISRAEHAANVALSAVTDNPVYIAADADHPNGRVVANGGYHNTMAWPAMDELAAAYADLCTLAERNTVRLLDGRVSGLPNLLLDAADDPRYMGSLAMAQVGFSEEAKRAAQRTFLPGSDGGGFGQNDVAVPSFFAWRAQAQAGARLEDCLAALAMVASQAFTITGARIPPALAPRLQRIRAMAPPLTNTIEPLAPMANALAEDFRTEMMQP